MDREKDVWDRLDVITRLVTGGVLALIAFFIKIGADNISTSLQTGDLVQRLITDLTSIDQQVRQDVALVALNHSVGDARPAMVAEIAELIFLNTAGADSS